MDKNFAKYLDLNVGHFADAEKRTASKLVIGGKKISIQLGNILHNFKKMTAWC